MQSLDIDHEPNKNDYSTWTNTNDESIYFKKSNEDENQWIEFHAGQKFSEFKEIKRTMSENGSLIVLLKKTDYLFIKLGAGQSLWKRDPMQTFSFVLSNGKWQNELDSRATSTAPKQLQWTKSNIVNQYFVKETTRKWGEYQNGTGYADFNEIKAYHEETGGLVVILKKFDGFLLKLTDGFCYTGFLENNLTGILCPGNWNFPKLKWITLDDEAHYYVTDGPEKWSEYKNESKCAEFIEIKSYMETDLVVVLKSCEDNDESKIIKLSGEMSYVVVDNVESKIEAGGWLHNPTLKSSKDNCK